MVEGKERTIIDYQLQKAKIYPHIAKSYAMWFSSKRISELMDLNTQKILNKGDFSLLKEIHIHLAGLKAMFTTWTSHGLLKLMQACGGHGFLVSAGIGPIIDKYMSNTILEGENNVLLIQVARELLKSLDYANRGEELKLLSSLGYFANIEKLENHKVSEEKEDWESLKIFKKMFERAIVVMTQKATVKVMGGVEDGLSMKASFDKKATFLLTRAAKLHSILVTFNFFNEKIESLADGPIRAAFQKLSLIFILDSLLEESNSLILTGTINGAHVRLAKDLFESLMEQIHVDGLRLAEGWAIPDILLNSTIGHSNGQVYENLYKMAKENGEFNKVDVQPMMLEHLKVRNELLKSVQENEFLKPKL
jgi:acyl-CoA oxidase